MEPKCDLLKILCNTINAGIMCPVFEIYKKICMPPTLDKIKSYYFM